MSRRVAVLVGFPSLQSEITESLHSRDQQSVVFESASEAVNLADVRTIDLIITDGTISDLPLEYLLLYFSIFSIPIILLHSGARNMVNSAGVSLADRTILYSPDYLRQLLEAVRELLSDTHNKLPENDRSSTGHMVEGSDRPAEILTEMLVRRSLANHLLDEMFAIDTDITDYTATFSRMGQVLGSFFPCVCSVVGLVRKQRGLIQEMIFESSGTGVCKNATGEIARVLGVDALQLLPRIELSDSTYRKKEHQHGSVPKQEGRPQQKLKKVTSGIRGNDGSKIQDSDRTPRNSDFRKGGNSETGCVVVYGYFDDDELGILTLLLPMLIRFFTILTEYRDTVQLAGRLRYQFESFLPAKVIDDLVKKQDIKSLMTGEKRSICVLFSHVMHFSELEHENSAEKVVRFLNAHFTALSTCIKRYGGEVNKFIGDGLFAMFGAPESYVYNERRACLAALDIQHYVRNALNEGIHLPECGYAVGIGIHTGKAIIGNIGSPDNFDYTAIGDTVNLAARLESLNKHYGTYILISEATYNTVGSLTGELLEMDTVMVKGKAEPTKFYSLASQPVYSEECIRLYRKGLKMYRLGNFHFALDYFSKCLRMVPDDAHMLRYKERCCKFIDTPPETWTGAVQLDFK